jgi:hypothetical protein
LFLIFYGKTKKYESIEVQVDTAIDATKKAANKVDNKA